MKVKNIENEIIFLEIIFIHVLLYLTPNEIFYILYLILYLIYRM